MDKPRITKRSKLIKVGDFLDTVMQKMKGTLSDDGGESLEEIQKAWESVVGKTIKNNTSLTSYKGGVLVVSVKKSVWRSEIEFMKVDIVRKINKYIGTSELRNIILR